MKILRFIRPALFGMILLPPAALSAQTLPDLKPLPPMSQADKAAYHYDVAVALLEKGKDFERAIGLLKNAVQIEPKNRAYHLALGCAYACRAAAIGNAAGGREKLLADQEMYKKWQTEWEAAQKDPANPAYRQPAPKPPILTTKDDGLPFTLKLEDTIKVYLQLYAEAKKEWDIALTLSQTPQEKAKTLYTQGWGKLLVRKYNSDLAPRELNAKEKPLVFPMELEIVQDFTEATKIDPKNARYWQSLGDALIKRVWSKMTNGEIALVIAAYRQSLKFNANNPSLWYRVYQMSRTYDINLAETAIRNAVLADSDNAFLSFRLAGALLEETRLHDFDKPYKIGQIAEDDATTLKRIQNIPETEEDKRRAEEAFSAIERGNTMGHCNTVAYVIPVPDLLITTWNFQGEFASYSAEMKEIFALHDLLAGYGKTKLQENNPAAARRAADAMVGFGRRQLNEETQKNSADVMISLRIQDAITVIEDGYHLVQEICRATNDTATAMQAKTECETLQAQCAALLKAQRTARANRYGY